MKARPFVPHTIRFRLSVTYAALFLLAGAVLLAITYGLVANSLSGNRSQTVLTQHRELNLKLACEKDKLGSLPPGNGKARAPRSVSSACTKLVMESAGAATSSQRARTLESLLTFSLVGLGVITVLSGGLGWVMAGRALRPVSAITGAARRASDRHLGERLGFRGPDDELKELADTFDDMLERLDVAFATQRRFVADASHELRTPLTVMRTAIDVTLAKPHRSPDQLDAMAAKIRRSVDQAEGLIDALLTLAVSDHGVLAAEHVDLATAVEDALDAASPEISRLHLHVACQLSPAEAWGDQPLLERMAGNLVDNAVRHNVVGGWIDVATGARDTGSFIEVSNGGRVIDDGLVETLFEPFRRVEERTGGVGLSGGVGLGLSIVRSIAHAHAGRVEARPIEGGGLRVSVRLPAAQIGADRVGID